MPLRSSGGGIIKRFTLAGASHGAKSFIVRIESPRISNIMGKNENDNARKLNRAIAPILSAMKPPENITVSQWADKNRRLSSEASAEVGRWRTSRTPYMLDILDCFTDPKVQHIVVVSASQVGKSEAINNMIGYCIDQDPGPILLVEPTVQDAKEYSQQRIAPMIRETRCLRRKVSAVKSRDSGNTILQKSFPGGMITLTGSTEAHALASKPIRYLFGDERDRWALSAGSEGNPWDLAIARTRTFYNKKLVEVSTPTVKNHSAIAASYELGTREHWVTQCPHCENFHEIQFEDIRFEYTVSGESESNRIFDITKIFYVCPECGGISSENEMKKQPSKWQADSPEAVALHNCRSFWLTAFVSPWATWKSIILQFLQAGHDSAKLQVCFNTQFGKLWENRGGMESDDVYLARREKYDAEIPEGVIVLTCGVDTQDDRLEYEVVGYGHFGESWGIKAGIIMGQPDTDEVWQALDDVISHPYAFADGRTLKISLTFVDEGGHYTQEVRRRCLERQRQNVFPIKGEDGSTNRDIPYTSPPKKQKIIIGGKFIDYVWVYAIGVSDGKQIIFDNLRVQTPGPKYCHFPLRDDYGPAYFKGLLSEHLVYNEKLKNPWQWEKIPGHERNERLDCRNYANAACKALDPDFDAIEKRMKAPPMQSKTASEPIKRKSVKRPEDFYNDW